MESVALHRPVPTVGCMGCQTPLEKCSVGKSSNLPFLLAYVFTFLHFGAYEEELGAVA